MKKPVIHEQKTVDHETVEKILERVERAARSKHEVIASEDKTKSEHSRHQPVSAALHSHASRMTLKRSKKNFQLVQYAASAGSYTIRL